MRTLAIDTSHAAGSVVAKDETGSATRALGEATGHARALAGALAAAAAERGWRVAAAELVAVVRGPGSFTGLRVGVATAKAIAWAAGSRLVGVSGFEVLATAAASAEGWRSGAIEVAFDAGRGEVFAATLLPDAAASAGWAPVTGRLVAADAWADGLPPRSRTTGPALAIHAARLAAAGHAVADPAIWFPTAAGAALVAGRRAEAGAADDPAALVPDYVRPHYAAERPA